MTSSDQSNSFGRSELMTTHSKFGATRIDGCYCETCSWSATGRVTTQGGATAAAKRHVDEHPTHRVITRRIQVKATYARKVTVLR